MTESEAHRRTDVMTIDQALTSAAKHFPAHGVHVIDAAGEVRLCSYPTLLEAALARLDELHAAGVGEGDRIIMQLRDPARFLQIFWACQLGGIVPVAATPVLAAAPDAASGLSHVASVLVDAKIVTDTGDRLRLMQRLDARYAERVVAIGMQFRPDGSVPAESTAASTDPDRVALMLMTSGSSGKPKLVMQTHRALLFQARGSAARCGLDAYDVALNWLPLEHVGALVMFHLRDVVLGCHQYQARMEAFVNQPAAWLDWLEKFRITVSWAPNFAYAQVAALGESADAGSRDLSRVRVLINGGEPIIATQAREFLRLLAPAGLRDDAMWPVWGMSETCSAVTFSERFRGSDDDPGPVDLGPPLDGVEMRITDENDQALGEGEKGMLQVRADCVSIGYFGNPSANSETFSDDGWLRTGDLGISRNARLSLLGRAKDELIVNGRNLACSSLEAAAQTVARVRPATACAFSSQQDGSLIVVYAPQADAERDAHEVSANIKACIAGRLGVRVAQVFALPAEEIPRTSIGKIQRAELIRRHANGELGDTFDDATASDEQQTSIPLTECEQALAEIWQTLLGKRPGRASDDFFAMGGQSLDGIRLATRVAQTFGVELLPVALFENPGLGAYAAQIERSRLENAHDQAAIDTRKKAPNGRTPDTTKASGKNLTRRERLAQLMRASRAQSTDAQPRATIGPVPATPAQQALWMLEQLDSTGSAYAVVQLTRIVGALDITALEKALAALLARHDALRSRFDLDGDRLMMITEAAVKMPLVQHDLCTATDAGHDADALQARVREFTERRFDLGCAPAMRALLLKTAAQQYQFVLVTHHIVTDGWSVGIINRDLTALYSACRDGQPATLAPLPSGFAEFARWHQGRSETNRQAEALAYWRKQLDGIENLSLPLDRPRPVHGSHVAGQHLAHIDQQTTSSLRALARSEGATLYMLLLAAFQILLMRHSGSQDIAVGTPVAGRSRVDDEAVVGYFVNMLVMRSDLSGEPDVPDVLKRVREGTLAALRHQNMPFERLVSALSPAREPGANPLFQVSFALQNTPAITLQLADTQCVDARPASMHAQFDLELTLTEIDGGLALELAYAAELFEQTHIERMVSNFQNLLAEMLRNAQRPIGELPILTPAERRQQLLEWNSNRAVWPGEQRIVELIEAQARARPDAPALSFADQTLSYQALEQRANRLARVLRAMGVAPNMLVAMCVDRGFDMIVTALAILKSGGAYLPLDAQHPDARLNAVLADATPSVLIAKTAQIDRLNLPQSCRAVAIDDPSRELAAQLASQSPDRLEAAGAPTDLAYVLYTSGSTGRPKGVMIEHHSLHNHTAWIAAEFGLIATDRVLARTTLSFDAAGVEIWPTLSVGAQLIIADEQQQREPAALLDLLSEHRITRAQFVPALLGALLDELGTRPAPESLHTVFVGGDVLMPADALRWSRQAGAELVNLYGPTECTIDTSFHRWQPDAGAGPIPVGRPVANCQLYVLDSGLQPVPIGTTGEICVGGSGLARGYLGRSDLDEACFVQAPFNECKGERLYRTGDLGRFDAHGQLLFLGRRDRQVKLRGYRIELEDIESGLVGCGARSAAAGLVRNASGVQQLLAWVEPADLDTSQLKSKLAECLPPYMLPNAILKIETLPRLANGKIDRKQLPAPASDPLDTQFEAPLGPTQRLIANSFSEMLGLDRIDIHTDFFEAGGNSLLAARAATRIARSSGLPVKLGMLFEWPTIALLANHLDTLESGSQSSHAKIDRSMQQTEAVAATPGQRALWFLEQLDGPSNRYNMSLTWRLVGSLDIRALEQALTDLFERHGLLRTSFVDSDGLPVLAVQSACSLPLNRDSLTGTSPAAKEQQLDALLTAHESRPFELSQAPLLRVLLIECDANSHLLQLVMHHLVGDGWSMDLIRRELALLYRSHSMADRTAALPAAPQFIDYARNLQHTNDTAAHDRDFAYWQRRLKNLPSLALAADRPQACDPQAPAITTSIELPDALSERLQELARQHQATEFALMLAAFKLLLSRYAGQPDVAVGIPVIRRDEPGLEDMIGYLIDTLVIRDDLSGDPCFDELLARVRTSMTEALDHRTLPYDAMVARLHQSAGAGRNPLFDVMVNYYEQNGPTADWGPLQVTEIDQRPAPAKFALTLYIRRRGKHLHLRLACRQGQFSPAWANTALAHFRSLLEQVSRAFTAPISTYTLALIGRMPVDARSAIPVVPQPSVLHRFLNHAQVHPDAPAVQSEQGMLSYGQLAGRALALSAVLRERGVRAAEVVAIRAQSGPGLVGAMLATLARAAVFMPIDPALPEARQRTMLRESGAVLLCDLSAADAHCQAVPDSEHADHFICPVLSVDDQLQTFAGHDGDIDHLELIEAVPGEAPAYVFFTSGSSGTPKAVLGQRQGLDHFIAWQAERFGLSGSDRVSALINVGFDPMLRDVFLPLANGASIWIAPDHVAGQTPDWLARAGISIVHSTPSVLENWIASLDAPVAVSALRLLFVSGEALDARLIERCRAMLIGDYQIVNLYGPTETTMACCFHVIAHDHGPGIQPVGRPISDTQIQVLDADGQQLGTNISGEIAVRTPYRALGYINTASAAMSGYRSNRARDDDKDLIYFTGDVGHWRPDGTLILEGRNDEQIKIRGVRIEPDEIAGLITTHPGVDRCRVVAQTDRFGEKHLHAFVVPNAADAGEPISIAQLRALAERELPASHVPRAFGILTEFPLLPNGKLDRAALPPVIAEAPSNDYQAPVGPVETALAAIWASLLAHPRPSRDDSFFELGGHSLLASRLLACIRAEMHCSLPLRAVFDAPQLAQLAARIALAAKPDKPDAALAHAEPTDNLARLINADAHTDVPASSPEQALHFLAAIASSGAAYNLSRVVFIDGAVDTALLRRSLAELVARHDALRSHFCEHAGQLVRRIRTEAKADLNESVQLDDAARSLMIAKICQDPFDLEHGPLWRAALIAGKDNTHYLILAAHHIISDAWSMNMLVGELAQVYRKLQTAGSPDLAPLRLSYAQHSRERGRSDTTRQADALPYWRAQLSGLEPLDLPRDRPRPNTPNATASVHGFQIDGSRLAQLKALSRRHKASLFIVLLSIWKCVLVRHTGQSDIAVGTTVAGRSQTELEPLFGYFANVLVLRTTIAGNPGFDELLAQVRNTVLEALEHQEMPFDRLVAELSPQRSANINPLFQVAFTLYNMAEARFDIPGAHCRLESLGNRQAKFDLNLSFREDAGQLVGTIEYADELFDAARIERLSEHLQQLVDQVLADESVALGSLILPSSTERDLLGAWANGPHQDYDGNEPLLAAFERHARETPDTIALVCDGRETSYRRLNEQANALAHRLRDQGVGDGSLIALCLQRDESMVLALLAIIKSGAAWLPLDGRLPAARLQLILDDAKPSLVLRDDGLDPALDAAFADLPCWRVGFDTKAPDHTRTSNPAPVGNAHSPAYLIYTSGSTGKPKGVVIERHSVNNLLASIQGLPGLDAGDRLLAVTTPSFDISIVELLVPLRAGACIVIALEAQLSDGIELGNLLRRSQATVLQATPTHWRMLLEAGWQGQSSLRALVGGEALSAELADALSQRTGELWNLYGPTETTIWSSVWRYDANANCISIGRPIHNTIIEVLDSFGQIAPVGVPGELYIGGAGLARAYHDRAQLTAERFIISPRDPHCRLYRTGDRGRWLAHGELEHLGRTDFQLKIRGHRIEPGEIEALICAHPDVRACAVVAAQDHQQSQRLLAYIAADERDDIRQALLQSLRTQLPGYMIPSALVFLDALPLLLNGKLNRQALPAPDLSVIGQYFAAPETTNERALAGLWCEILGRSQIARDDSFFEVGGHSLLAARMLARIRELHGLTIPVRSLFDAPTLREFGALLDATCGDLPGRDRKSGSEPRDIDAAHASSSPDMRVNSDASVQTHRIGHDADAHRDDMPILAVQDAIECAASSPQQALWYVEALGETQSPYHVGQLIRILGQLDLNALRAAFQTLAHRHDALRMSFIMRDGQLRARVRHRIDLPFNIHMRTGGNLSDSGSVDRATGLAQSLFEQSFDLAEGPLWRAAIVAVGPDDHLLVLVMHHIVTDGWSVGLMAHELTELYSASRSGRTHQLPDLTTNYAQEIARQAQLDANGGHADSLAFWRQRLEGIEPIGLPQDRPRPARRTHAGALHRFTLPAAPTRALNELAQRNRATLYMVLLGAWQALLARHSGQTDIAVGTPVFGRERPETEAMLGYFVNMLVMRSDLSGNPAFTELLGQVRAHTLGALSHQELPFDQLVSELNPVREPGVNPLFQVSFALQNTPDAAIEFAGTRCTPLELQGHRAKFDLTLSIQQSADGLNARIEYSTELFSASRIERLAAHFIRLLIQIGDDESLRFEDLDLVDANEQRRLLKWGQGPRAAYPNDRSLSALFEDRVRDCPNAPAIAFENTELSYAQLNSRANQLAHALRGAGARPGQYIALCMPRNTDMLIAMLGIVKAGAAYLPLDPAYPVDRLKAMIDDADPLLLLHGTGLDPDTRQCFDGRAAWCLTERAVAIAALPDHDPQPNCDGKSLAYLMYTSGSTGMPKGVMIEHAAITRLVLATNYVKLGPQDTLAQIANVSFDAATFEIWGAWLNGARLVVLPIETVLSGRMMANAIREHAITTIFLTTSLFNAHAASDPGLFGGLRYLLIGGEAADPVSMQTVLNCPTPPAQLLNCYGPTETTTFATFWRAPSDAQTLQRACSMGAPIGRPISNTHCQVLDPRGRPQPIGVTGELYIGGPGVARAYLNRAELNAQRFVPDVEATDAGMMYRTGDLVRWSEDGLLQYMGRNDQQVKIRGYRIELGEIDVALRRCPGVLEAATLVDEPVPGHKRIVSFVVTVNPAIELDALRTTLRSQLPAFMMPADIHRCDALPRNANGKLDRKLLLGLTKPLTARHEHRAAIDGPSAEQSGDASTPVEPTAARLLALWRRVLNRPELDCDAHFFESGGHSLLALRMLGEVEREFGQVLRVARLFDAPTVRAFAKLLDSDQNQHQQAGCAVTVQPGDARAPLFIVSGYGGEIVVFRELARELGRQQALVVLDTSAFSADDIRGENLEQVAVRMINDLRRIQPHGPYHLCGYSLGGKFVYEIARQLLRDGEQVKLLALMDCNAPGYPTRRSLGARLIAHGRQLLRQGPAQNLRYIRDKLSWAASRMQERDLFENARELAHTKIAQSMKASAEAMFLIWRDHQPGRYRGQLLVVRAGVRGERPGVIDDDPCLGWQAFVDGGVTVRDLDADHLSMLDAAHAGQLAGILRAHLGAIPRPGHESGRTDSAAEPGASIPPSRQAPSEPESPPSAVGQDRRSHNDRRQLDKQT